VRVTRPIRNSVAGQARRTQIVAATLELIAESGYPSATFARIAERAGLSSTRLISYHFTDKSALMDACVEHVVGLLGAAVGRRVRAGTTARGRLAAYINGVVEFSDNHRTSMAALLQILLSGAWSSALGTEPAAGHLEAILTGGQLNGELRAFDVQVVAATIQRAVEGLPFRLASEPGLDCTAWGRELVELVDRGVRADPT